MSKNTSPGSHVPLYKIMPFTLHVPVIVELGLVFEQCFMNEWPQTILQSWQLSSSTLQAVTKT